ncbi:hypothetical protein H4R35_004586 [Dimargaris xerosporica]|nr:hypothetical protein H4R35_004586 [Dimargaris xerosporica]
MQSGLNQNVGTVTHGSYEHSSSETTTTLGDLGMDALPGMLKSKSKSKSKKENNAEHTKTSEASGFEKLAEFHGKFPVHSGGKCGEKGLKFVAEMVNGVEVRPAETLDNAYYCDPKLFCSTYNYCTLATEENTQYYSKENEQFNKSFYMKDGITQKESSDKTTDPTALLDMLKQFAEKHANGEHVKEEEVTKAEKAGANTSKQFMETIAQALHAFAKYLESHHGAIGTKTETKSGKKSTGKTQMDIEAFKHKMNQFILSNDCQGDDLRLLQKIAKGGHSKTESHMIEEFLKKHKDQIQRQSAPQLPHGRGKSGFKPFVSHNESSAYYNDGTTEHQERKCKGEYCYFTPGTHPRSRQMHRGTDASAHRHNFGKAHRMNNFGKDHSHSHVHGHPNRHGHKHSHLRGHPYRHGHEHGHGRKLHGRPTVHQPMQFEVNYENKETFSSGPKGTFFDQHCKGSVCPYPSKAHVGTHHTTHKTPAAPGHTTTTGHKMTFLEKATMFLNSLSGKTPDQALKKIDQTIAVLEKKKAKLDAKKTHGAALSAHEIEQRENINAALSKLMDARNALTAANVNGATATTSAAKTTESTTAKTAPATTESTTTTASAAETTESTTTTASAAETTESTTTTASAAETTGPAGNNTQ